MRKLFYFLMLLPFVACGEKSASTTPEQPETKAPVLTLTSEATIEFEATGGAGEITYLLENAVEGTMLEATCEAEWVESLATGESVTFDVVENTTQEARDTKIIVAYGELSFDVVVKQSGANGGGNDDELEEDTEFVEGWAINGTMNDWVKSKATAMTEEGDYFVVKGFELAEDDSFTFILNGYEKNYGGNGQLSEPNFAYDAKAWGSDIRASVAGVYDIYLSTDLKNYYIMTEGADPKDAEVPLKPGEVRWTLFGSFEGNNYEDDILLVENGKYLSAKGVKFGDDMTFVVRCNGGEVSTLGTASDQTYALEGAITLVEMSESTYEIRVDAEVGVKYDIFFIPSDRAPQIWVMPEGRTPIIWNRVDGAYMPAYNNFLLYLITDDTTLTLDFKAGNETIVNYVIPAGTYYMGDTEGNGWCFDMNYCIAKVRGHEIPLLDGYMTIEHRDGKYDIYVDMRTATLEVIKMHYVGEIGFDPFFSNMGGLQLNSPAE